MTTNLKKVLVVEDNSNDLELTLEALAEYHMINTVDIARDGAEALDYLYCRGAFSDRARYNPAVVLLDL